jgi:murein DD-endopeptidase MepM/ murein hydrolase activator NlpD
LAILHDRHTPQAFGREHYLLAGLFAVCGSLLLAVVPGLAGAMRDGPDDTRVTLLALPESTRVSDAIGWQVQRVESGQTLGSLFESLGLSQRELNRVLAHPGARDPLSRLRPGRDLAFDIGIDGRLRGLRFERDAEHRVELRLREDRIEERVLPIRTERRVQVSSGVISSSLYADGARVGLSPSAINEMAKAFNYDIDFVEDLRDGDSFHVVYEELWREGQRVGTGNLLAASFVNRGHRYTAFPFERDGQVQYYDETGRPLKKALMRIPIEFARLSSTFGARRHPVLGRMRMHKGVDYAAPTGTPIMAAGDGRVSFVGWRNGYGRTVIIDHGQGRSTLYAHMSGFGNYRVGQRVGQGSTIGYVGATGLATGPHLHYEFRINGVQVNPLTVTMPRPEPLSGDQLTAFRNVNAVALAQLQELEGTAAARRSRQ